jgi:peptidyl-prolyl cis-trans isomerase SurA
MRHLLTSLLVAALSAGAARAADPTALNGMVAVVDGEPITYKDVDQQAALAVESKLSLYASRPDLLQQEIKRARQDALDILVARKLILHEFKQAGFSLPDSIIEDRVRARLRETWGGDRTSMTRDLQQRGLTFERFRENLRDDVILEAMQIKNIVREIIISPHKIAKYYADHLDSFKTGDSVQLRTIMINKPASGPADAARRRAEEIAGKLADGAAFAELAGVYSEDSYRSKGGDRGVVELDREHYQPALESAIRALKPGQRSGVIDAGTAYWIVLLEDAKLNHIRTLPEARSEIERLLLDEERARLRKAWIDRLKAKAFIRYF